MNRDLEAYGAAFRGEGAEGPIATPSQTRARTLGSIRETAELINRRYKRSGALEKMVTQDWFEDAGARRRPILRSDQNRSKLLNPRRRAMARWVHCETDDAKK